MPIRPEDFTDVAEWLHNDVAIASTGEGCIRTVAGRAYYGAYLSVRQAARDALAKNDFNASHNALASHLEGYDSDVFVETIGIKLKELKYYREIADYWPADTLDKKSIGLALNSAKSIVQDQAKLIPRLDVPRLRRLHEKQERPSR